MQRVTRIKSQSPVGALISHRLFITAANSYIRFTHRAVVPSMVFLADVVCLEFNMIKHSLIVSHIVCVSVCLGYS